MQVDEFTSVKQSHVETTVLELLDTDKPLSIVCVASNYNWQRAKAEGWRRLWPCHLLSAPAFGSCKTKLPCAWQGATFNKVCSFNFWVHLSSTDPFVVYTDHASLRTTINTSHLSPQMTRWLTFFSEFYFKVEYKPGKTNVLANALSHRPDFEVRHQVKV